MNAGPSRVSVIARPLMNTSRHRRIWFIATGLLVLMAVVFLAGRHFEHLHPAVGYVRAFAEAAMIGALADWFAVVALFRHPLGLPIPHTAIVPANRSRIGESLARFVRTSFLNADALAPKLRDWHLIGRIAEWLQGPENSARLAASCASTLSGVLRALDDGALSRFLREQAVSVIRSVPLAPIVATILDALMEARREQEIISGLLRWLVKFVSRNHAFMEERIREELPLGDKAAFSVLRSLVAARIASKLATKVEDTLNEVLDDPMHELRIHLHAEIIVLARRLREEPELAAKLEAWKEGLLQHTGLMQTLDAIWARVKQHAVADLQSPEAGTRLVLAEAFHRIGQAVASSESLREKLEDMAARSIAAIVEGQAGRMEAFMRETVEAWDADTLVAKLEAEVGADLQFIRINGTLVGGFVGLLIHACERWL